MAIEEVDAFKTKCGVDNSGSTTTMTMKETMAEETMLTIRPTAKRFLILLIYCISASIKSFHWISLCSVTNKVAFFYGVSNFAVNWTSVVFLLVFVVLALPSGWLIERIGLRKSLIIGTLGLVVGSLCKTLGSREDGFWLVMVGQFVLAATEQFIFCVASKLASTWFPDAQVSRATSVCLVGNQLGLATAFLVPHLMLDGRDTREEIAVGLYNMQLYTLILSAANLLAVLLVFDDAPEFPPGAARLRSLLAERKRAETNESRMSFATELRWCLDQYFKILSTGNTCLLVSSYAIVVSTSYAYQAVVNQMVVQSGWSDINLITSTSGQIIIFASLFGLVFWGYLCDLTRLYKLIAISLYALSILSIGLIGLTLSHPNVWLFYASSALLGFSIFGYIIVGWDTMIEVTYPQPEMISTSFLNFITEICGVLITFAASHLIDQYGNDVAVGSILGLLAFGFTLSLAFKETLNRQAAISAAKSSELADKPTRLSDVA